MEKIWESWCKHLLQISDLSIAYQTVPDWRRAEVALQALKYVVGPMHPGWV